MTRILLHVCCAPCAVAPLGDLRDGGFDVTGFWYNPNIHPYTEYQRRLAAVRSYLETEGLPLLENDSYDLVEHLRRSAFREGDRCPFCYDMRLSEAARFARRGRFPAFTTTLLYSSYMDREAVIRVGRQAARDVGVEFHEADWRQRYKESLRISKEKGLYRQSYCGCIYSEAERFAGLDLGGGKGKSRGKRGKAGSGMEDG